jgi:hypothetical protein
MECGNTLTEGGMKSIQTVGSVFALCDLVLVTCYSCGGTGAIEALSPLRQARLESNARRRGLRRAAIGGVTVVIATVFATTTRRR